MKTYYFWSPLFGGVHTLTNSEEFARRYAEKNLERVIVFTKDDDEG